MFFDNYEAMMKTIDIGHGNLSVDAALSALESGVSSAMCNGEIRSIKIVHGHGSGALRNAVRQWCQEQSGRFRDVIPGEEYDLFHQNSVAMRQECSLPIDRDLGRKNRAVTYLWLL